MQENICNTHFGQIVSKDDNNQDQCEVCLENEHFNKMLKIEKIIKLSQCIVDQSKNNHEIQEIQKTNDLINKYKAYLPQSFAKRRSQYKYEMLQVHEYKNFKYKLINQFSNYDWKRCYSLVFNSNSTLLFIGLKDDISVYEFKNGEIKNQLQRLTYHKDNVCCLIYLNKSNLLVSGSCDKSIVIWNQDQSKSWKLYLILKGYQGKIACLINNEDEDLLISSNNNAIQFWRKMNMNWSSQQTIKSQFYETRLSLSKSSKTLIICGKFCKQIFVVEWKLNYKWIIEQKINTKNEGHNLIFISDREFVYQDVFNQIEVYFYDQKKKQFVKNKQINIEIHKEDFVFNYPYPCKYIEQKNILIIPYDKQLNFFRLDEKQDYILLQSIEYDLVFYGNISNNGQYIITKEEFSNEIQVRQLQYLQ